MDILFLFIILFLLITINVPIGLSIGGATIATFMIFSDLSLELVAQYSIRGIDSFPIMAIPFFMLAGTIMSLGGIAQRIIDVSVACVGFIVGGLGAVVTLASMFFAALSGSSLATVSAIGGSMIPQMTKKGYNVGYSAALTACAGTMGVIIPPSIPLVIYGVVTGTSIGSLFIAGIIPGILIGIGIMIANYILSKKNKFGEKVKRPPLKLTLKYIWDAKWALLTPVIILGGIYIGIFTPTEAAVVAVVYAIIVSMLIYKELNLKGLYNALVETAVINGITSFLLGLSTAFAAYLSLEQIPIKLMTFLTNLTDNKILLLLIINVALLIIGCVVDNIPATIILSPMLLPVMQNLGIDPIQFGIIITINLTIGLVTPPYGCNLFVASAVSNIKMEAMLKYLWPFLAALVAILLLVTYVPFISMAFV